MAGALCPVPCALCPLTWYSLLLPKVYHGQWAYGLCLWPVWPVFFAHGLLPQEGQRLYNLWPMVGGLPCVLRPLTWYSLLLPDVYHGQWAYGLCLWPIVSRR